jgi:hypothetical protein
MAEDANGVPKTRPVPQDIHVDAAQREADFTRAVRIVMAKENLPWPDAAAKVEGKVDEILAAHDAPYPEPKAEKEPGPETKAETEPEPSPKVVTIQ